MGYFSNGSPNKLKHKLPGPGQAITRAQDLISSFKQKKKNNMLDNFFKERGVE